MVVSVFAGVSLEDIAKCAPEGLRWLNIYTLDRDDVKQVVQRAEDEGYQGIFVTCDKPPVGSMKRALRPFPDELKRNVVRFVILVNLRNSYANANDSIMLFSIQMQMSMY